MHILKRLNHPNIVSLKEILVPNLHLIPIDERKLKLSELRSKCFHELNQGKKDFLKSFGHLYLVFEFVETDLRKIIESDQFMTKAHIRFILYQILRAIKYVHTANVIHRYPYITS
jgi:serine/threonine protein kinase